MGDEGAMPGTAVRVTVPAGSSRKLTSAELESGEADAIDSGALGDGDGKWCLRVASDMPILVVEQTCNDVSARPQGALSARFVGAPFGWSPVRPSPRCAHSTYPGTTSRPRLARNTLATTDTREATVVTVSVAGSGVAGSVDFAPVADFAITIAAGAPRGEGSFTLTPEDDAVSEADEALTVSGTSDLPVTSTGVTLVDDDEASAAVVLTAVPGRVSEGAGATRVTVTASLDRGLRGAPTTVAVAVAGRGDPAAVDFAPVPDFEIVIAAGTAAGTGTFILDPEADAVVESDETLTVSGTSDLPVTPAVVTLSDDDEASTRIVLSAVPARVSEGARPTPVAVTATLDRPACGAEIGACARPRP